MKINITLPCYNEAKILENNVITLFNFLNKNIINDDWQIIISDNNSIDDTSQIAKRLEEKFKQIKYLFVPYKGKGIAIKHGWQKFEADVYIFMDADLSTDLKDLPKLINAIKEEHYDVVIGSRFHKLSKVKRGLIRKIISYSYRTVKKILVNSSASDIPCGFKAINKEIVKKLLPQIKNNKWFFDSELVILAENQGYKIKEIPIQWEDIREKQDKSRVSIISLSFNYFKNIIKLKKRLANKKKGGEF